MDDLEIRVRKKEHKWIVSLHSNKGEVLDRRECEFMGAIGPTINQLLERRNEQTIRRNR
jgi:hypothetical protein